jgi:sRNA-binding carbon storage regulator CsrA
VSRTVSAGTAGGRGVAVGRLILRRRTGESLTIGDDINVQVVSAHGSGREACTVRFRIGEELVVDVTKEGRHIKFMIEAPESLIILRDELTRRSVESTNTNKSPAEPQAVPHPQASR